MKDDITMRSGSHTTNVAGSLRLDKGKGGQKLGDTSFKHVCLLSLCGSAKLKQSEFRIS